MREHETDQQTAIIITLKKFVSTYPAEQKLKSLIVGFSLDIIIDCFRMTETATVRLTTGFWTGHIKLLQSVKNLNKRSSSVTQISRGGSLACLA